MTSVLNQESFSNLVFRDGRIARVRAKFRPIAGRATLRILNRASRFATQSDLAHFSADVANAVLYMQGFYYNTLNLLRSINASCVRFLDSCEMYMFTFQIHQNQSAYEILTANTQSLRLNQIWVKYVKFFSERENACFLNNILCLCLLFQHARLFQ